MPSACATDGPTSPNASLLETAAAPQKAHSAEIMRFYQCVIATDQATTPVWTPQNSENGRIRGLLYTIGEAASASDTMKLHATSTKQYQTVTAYDDNGVEINALPYAFSMIVLPESEPVQWPVANFEALTEAHFAQIDATKPDVVILGTGKRQRFVHPKLTQVLTSRRIGIECMDNQAACRTYNILMAEGRKVALALIMETPAAGGTA
jgi:uncharacterized protein